MLDALCPQRIDNTYRGYKLALWLFGLVVFMRIAQGLVCIFDGYSVAMSADGIPLDTYTPAGAQAVVSMFALLGLFHVIIGLVCVLVLLRYRGMVPFMFALLILEFLGRRLILQLLPIARTGVPPGSIVNLVVLGVMIVGLVLSLWRRGE